MAFWSCEGPPCLGSQANVLFYAPSRQTLERAYACCVNAVHRAGQPHDANKAASSGAAPACARSCCVATYGATPRARNGITFHHPCHFGSDLDQIYGHRTLPSRVTNGDANWARLGRSNIFCVIQKGQVSRKGSYTPPSCCHLHSERSTMHPPRTPAASDRYGARPLTQVPLRRARTRTTTTTTRYERRTSNVERRDARVTSNNARAHVAARRHDRHRDHDTDHDRDRCGPPRRGCRAARPTRATSDVSHKPT